MPQMAPSAWLLLYTVFLLSLLAVFSVVYFNKNLDGGGSPSGGLTGLSELHWAW